MSSLGRLACSTALALQALAAPQALTAPGLFSDRLGPSADRRADWPAAVIRRRETDVNLPLLGGAGVSIDGHAPAMSIVLNLFHDVEYVARFDHVEIVASLGYAWVGSIVGRRGSTVFLAISNDVLSGSVDDGAAFYSVYSVAPGRYHIDQVDRSKLPKG
jgi:hypothetical protein